MAGSLTWNISRVGIPGASGCVGVAIGGAGGETG